MRLALITPASPTSRYGNRRTAERWAAFLQDDGHEVSISESWTGEPADAMLALHARRSHESITRFATEYPRKALIVALTGTDLYRDIHHDKNAQESLALATRLVVLQEAGLMELSPVHREKTWVVYQSAEPVERRRPSEKSFEVVVIGHLRTEKDPFRAALAATLLPPASRIRVIQAGGARDPILAAEAESLMRDNQRYRWLGEVSHEEVRDLLSRARLLVQSSFMEGGANAISEALAAELPVVASDIPGNIGMLGAGYPGYYPPGDEQALARILQKAERDAGFYAKLQAGCEMRRHLVSAEHERESLRALISTLAVGQTGYNARHG